MKPYVNEVKHLLAESEQQTNATDINIYSTLSASDRIIKHSSGVARYYSLYPTLLNLSPSAIEKHSRNIS
jgi:hypothetical protein